MIGYLIYDSVDIERNQQFINWFIEEGQSLDIDIMLRHQGNYLQGPLPDFVINRSRLADISKYFIQEKVKVFNSYEVTEITNDKWATYLHFKDHIKMLDTEIYNHEFHLPAVVKNRFGHGGTDVHLLKTHGDYSNDYIIQALSPTVGKDLRVYIIGNTILDCVLRTSDHDFKSNYSLGGQIAPYQLSDQEKAIVHKILDIMPLDYGGIDFLFDENNNLILNEIEDAVGARMLYNLYDHNVVKLYLDHIKATLNVN